MPFRITVTKVEPLAIQPVTASHGTGGGGANYTLVPETEIFRQTVDTLDLPNFVLSLNKRTRTRKVKADGLHKMLVAK